MLLVSLGCEGFNKGGLLETARESGRPAKLVVIQDSGGTRKTIAEGQAWIEQTLAQLELTPRAPMQLDELVVGTKCGGSDATSGLTANPAMGRAFDFLVEQGAACIFEETGELIGMEHWMAQRAATPELGQEIDQDRGQGGPLLRSDRARELRAGQRRRRAHHHRGEVTGRLRQERAVGDQRASSSRATRRSAAGST